ncbi:hypothetical protein SDC9_166728 [bioreactor metagenome]|uniref:Uncharacterized protein n=1 Tax=bioreactor metagenome TaxID=1076179 RepID=A0A645G0C2_9ZZZZ
MSAALGFFVVGFIKDFVPDAVFVCARFLLLSAFLAAGFFRLLRRKRFLLFAPDERFRFRFRLRFALLGRLCFRPPDEGVGLGGLFCRGSCRRAKRSIAHDLMIQFGLNRTHIGADLRIGGDISLNQVAKPEVPAIVLLLLLHNCNKLPEGLACGFTREVFVPRALKGALIDRAAICGNKLLDGFFFAATDAADQFCELHA